MNQVTLNIEPRTETGKGASGRMRLAGRVPGVVYGHEVEPTPVSFDALEFYHAMHGPAGRNVLITLEISGEDHLCVARDIQRHPVRGDYVHIDLLSVDKNATIVVDIPIHIEGEIEGAGIVSQVLGSVPIHVAPLKTPNAFELSIDGLDIGDVLRVSDLESQLPEGSSFDIDPERTVVTINAPQALEVEEDDDVLGLGDEEAAEPAADASADADA